MWNWRKTRGLRAYTYVLYGSFEDKSNQDKSHKSSSSSKPLIISTHFRVIFLV